MNDNLEMAKNEGVSGRSNNGGRTSQTSFALCVSSGPQSGT